MKICNKMIHLIVLCVHMVTICAAPLQSLQQLQATHLTPLQQQLLVLQQMEMLQRMTAKASTAINPAPVLLLLPNFPAIQNINDIINKPSEVSAKEYMKLKTSNNESQDEDSVVINAESAEGDTGRIAERPILLIPNRGRLSIGEIISAIPFLPIEINVPDTISWMYNGIAGIISGIGQRFPFKRPQNMPMTQENLRVLLKQQELQQQFQIQPLQQQPVVNVLPIVIVPIDAPIVAS